MLLFSLPLSLSLFLSLWKIFTLFEITELPTSMRKLRRNSSSTLATKIFQFQTIVSRANRNLDDPATRTILTQPDPSGGEWWLQPW